MFIYQNCFSFGTLRPYMGLCPGPHYGLQSITLPTVESKKFLKLYYVSKISYKRL